MNKGHFQKERNFNDAFMCYEESENPRPSVKHGIVNGNVGNFDNQASVSNF